MNRSELIINLMEDSPHINHLNEIAHIKHETVTDQSGIQQYDYVFKVITIGDPGKFPLSLQLE